nr:hypothetical protein [Ktedonobacteraceae bacterium]
MNQHHALYAALIARIRIHCQHLIRDAERHAGSAWPGKGYLQWYIPERTSFIALKEGRNGQELFPAFPPATEQQILETEQHLGFPLPPLLRLLYIQIANGGFGPGHG